MLTYLFAATILLGVLAVALYFWQKPGHRKQLSGLDAEPPRLPPSDSRGLFPGSGDESDSAVSYSVSSVDRSALIERAQNGDQTVLQDAVDDRAIYNEALDLLLEQADSEPKLLSLVSYVGSNELPVTKPLAEAFIASWLRAPSRGKTPSMLHITALADDATLYQTAVKTALLAWRDGRLSDISPVELRALFDGEFWVLSSATRKSGAGFMLKRTLAKARRELEGALAK